MKFISILFVLLILALAGGFVAFAIMDVPVQTETKTIQITQDNAS